jgi:hypothetical protein
MGFEVSDQRRAVGLALGGLAQAVDRSRRSSPIGQAQVAPQGAQHQDQLGVHVRPGKAQGLGADLVELTRSGPSAGRSWRNIGPM